MFVHPEVDFKNSKTQIILKRKKKTVIVKPYRKISWQLPKTKQGKSRDQSQISSPASIAWSFSKTPFCGGNRGDSQDPGLGRSHWDTEAAVQMVTVEPNSVLKCESVQVCKCASVQRVGLRGHQHCSEVLSLQCSEVCKSAEGGSYSVIWVTNAPYLQHQMNPLTRT